MAKKRREPEKSVDSEEEDFSSDESGGSDSEPEPPLTQVSKKPFAFSPNKPKPSCQSKRSSPTNSTDGSKRASDGEAKELKRSKKKPNAEIGSSAKNSLIEDSKKKPIAEVGSWAKKPLTEDSKKQLFQRLWSEEDEITILKGMIEYAAEKNADPVADLTAFHDFILKLLHLDATRTQLQDKIRRLRKKYENNAHKEKKGKERTFSKSHEQNVYDLSKKIWGSHNTQNGSVADGENNVEGSQTRSLARGSLFGKSLNDLAEWIETEKNKVGISEEKLGKLEEKWKSLRTAELKLFLKKAELVHEHGMMILDALK